MLCFSITTVLYAGQKPAKLQDVFIADQIHLTQKLSNVLLFEVLFGSTTHRLNHQNNFKPLFSQIKSNIAFLHKL